MFFPDLSSLWNVYVGLKAKWNGNEQIWTWQNEDKFRNSYLNKNHSISQPMNNESHVVVHFNDHFHELSFQVLKSLTAVKAYIVCELHVFSP